MSIIYAEVEMKVVQWGDARGIVQNTTAVSQGQLALGRLRQRAAEHDASPSEEYQEYAAGLREAVKAFEPFMA